MVCSSRREISAPTLEELWMRKRARRALLSLRPLPPSLPQSRTPHRSQAACFASEPPGSFLPGACKGLGGPRLVGLRGFELQNT